MNQKMIKVIEKDLGLKIDAVRNSSWHELGVRTRRTTGIFSVFRTNHHFIPNGNIHMEQNRFMDTGIIDLRNKFRYIKHRIKRWALKNTENKSMKFI